ncbi:transmembrane protein 223 [Euwallacea fornicatus]|uniref:transmembrane protein 223 n=1 Tax=Euwallacea fornicatus TaxID=995702 RepID=UPI00338E7195
MNSLIRFCAKGRQTPSIGQQVWINSSKFTTQRSLDVKTNVIKDVILYKSNNDRFFKVVNWFGVSQFCFWSYLSMTAFQTLKDIPVSPDSKDIWWRKINFGDSKWKNSLTIISFVIGWGILSVTWIYTLRAVKYLILRKGGQQATIITYAPFGKNRMFTLDLQCISATQARSAALSFIPLKVKGHWFYYMIDMNGEFKNALLFDNTAGLKRVWRD